MSDEIKREVGITFEKAHKLAWELWAPVLEGLLAGPVKNIPCSITAEDVALLEESYLAQTPLKNTALSRELYLYLVNQFVRTKSQANNRLGMSLKDHAVLTLHLFSEPLEIDGVPLSAQYVIRDRAAHFINVLREQSGRDFTRLEDGVELFWRVWIDRIKHELYTEGHEISSDYEVIRELAEAVERRELIPALQSFKDGFAAVFQATLMPICSKLGIEPWDYADELSSRIFITNHRG